MHCVHKAGGWQPKAAGGWFALLILPHKPDSYSNDSSYIHRIEALETTPPLINHLKTLWEKIVGEWSVEVKGIKDRTI
jgi:hypothetical protein